MDWTFLRPNYYMQNMLMYVGSIARTNSFALPLGAAKTAMIDSRDVGEVAAVVLTAVVLTMAVLPGLVAPPVLAPRQTCR